MQSGIEPADIQMLIESLNVMPEFRDLRPNINNNNAPLPPLPLTRSPSFFQPAEDLFGIIDNSELDKLVHYCQTNPDGILTARNDRGESPLHVAVSFASPTQVRLEIIKIILSHNVDLAAQDSEGMTPIHNAAKAPHAVQALQLLLAHAWRICIANDEKNAFALPNLSKLVDIQDSRGMTALHYALVGGRIESVECLLMHRASITLRENSKHATPLLWCFSIAPVLTIERAIMLILAYSDSSAFGGLYKLDLDAADDSGNTLMHYASLNGAAKVVQVLIRHGATVDPVNKEGKKPQEYLPKRHAEESKQILQYIKCPAIAKTENVFLAICEPKNLAQYINTLHGVAPVKGTAKNGLKVSTEQQVEDVSKAQRGSSSSGISSPLHVIKRHETMQNTKPEISESFTKLRARLIDLVDVSKQFVQELQFLTQNANDLYRQHRCKAFIDSYGCVIKLAESSDFVNNILAVPARKLEMDSSYCFLTIDQYIKSREQLNHTISHIMEQLDAIKGCVVRDIMSETETLKNIDTMSDKELKSTFSGYEIKTIKAIYKDKATLEVFCTGITNQLAESRAIAKKYSAVNAVFTSVQKFVSIVELVQHIFKVSSQNKSSEIVIRELKYLIDQVFASNAPVIDEESNSSTPIQAVPL